MVKKKIPRRRLIHRLSEIDEIARKGVCAHCGPVDLRKAGEGWRCATYAREKDRRRSGESKRGYPPGYQPPHPGKCPICHRRGELVWDHCHTKLKFRGMICRRCNVGLGMFADNPESLRRAARYVERR